MARYEYNKLKRFITLDSLLRSPDGCTKKDIFDEIDEISGRQLSENLAELEKSFGAVFVTPAPKRGKERVWKYADPHFSIIPKLDTTLERIDKMISELNMNGDPRYDIMRFSLLQMRYGIKEGVPPVFLFQYNPQNEGMFFLDSLADAIVHKKPVHIKYTPFNGPTLDYNVHPYHLAEYNYRWSLVCWCEEDSDIRIYPLDRIEDVRPLSKPYIPAKEDFNDHFKDVIGLTNRRNRPVERVVLRVDGKRYDYIETKPMHSSQEVLSKGDSYVDIELRVKLNVELEMQIMSYGDSIEVLEPAELRKTIRDKVSGMYAKYNSK